MKVLITGANGQLGWELQRTVPDGVEALALDRSALDISDREQVNQLIASERPDWVINTAAYTAVDKAEEEVEPAYAINRDGAANLAQACSHNGCRMVQLSTDYIFDGSQSTPYLTNSKPAPLSVYGASKLAGEELVLMALPEASAIVRTSWVYSSHGNNFVKTMLHLMAEREALSVIEDQIGTPTWANGLARVIWQIVDTETTGILHWSDAGVASWYDFAHAIYEEATQSGLLSNKCEIRPIATAQYAARAKRPHYSVLDKSEAISRLEMAPRDWREALRDMLKEFRTDPKQT